MTSYWFNRTKYTVGSEDGEPETSPPQRLVRYKLTYGDSSSEDAHCIVKWKGKTSTGKLKTKKYIQKIVHADGSEETVSMPTIDENSTSLPDQDIRGINISNGDTIQYAIYLLNTGEDEIDFNNAESIKKALSTDEQYVNSNGYICDTPGEGLGEITKTYHGKAAWYSNTYPNGEVTPPAGTYQMPICSGPGKTYNYNYISVHKHCPHGFWTKDGECRTYVTEDNKTVHYTDKSLENELINVIEVDLDHKEGWAYYYGDGLMERQKMLDGDSTRTKEEGTPIRYPIATAISTNNAWCNGTNTEGCSGKIVGSQHAEATDSDTGNIWNKDINHYLDKLAAKGTKGENSACYGYVNISFKVEDAKAYTESKSYVNNDVEVNRQDAVTKYVYSIQHMSSDINAGLITCDQPTATIDESIPVGDPDRISIDNKVPELAVMNGDKITYGIRFYNVGKNSIKLDYSVIDSPGQGLTYESIQGGTATKNTDGTLTITPPPNKTIEGYTDPNSPSYYDVYVTFRVDVTNPLEIAYVSNSVEGKEPIQIRTTYPISGKVFIDKKDYNSGKVTNPGNKMYDAGEAVEGVKVELVNLDGTPAEIIDDTGKIYNSVKTTNANGEYTFNYLPYKIYEINPVTGEIISEKYIKNPETGKMEKVETSYYIKFTYNGQEYENIKYAAHFKDGKITDEHNVIVDFNATYNENDSYATELKEDGLSKSRDSFNNTFKEINSSNSSSVSLIDENGKRKDVNYISDGFGINAYIGNNSPEQVNIMTPYKDNLNLGLVKREFDLTMKNQLESMDVSINGVKQTLNSINGGTISETLANQDVFFKESDYNYTGENELSVWANYKVTITNESKDNFIAVLNSFNYFYNSNFDGIEINGDKINLGNVVQDGKDNIFRKSNISIGQVEVEQGKSVEIKIRLHLSRETIANVIEEGNELLRTFETIAEIESYGSKYNGDIYENGHGIQNHNAGKVDEDSNAGNINMQDYVANIRSSTDVKKILGFFNKEDDARRALGIKLGVDENIRTLSGIVFEDATEQKNSNISGQKTRYGDGQYKKGNDKEIDVKVELVDGENVINVYDGKQWNKAETRSEKGNYTFKGFIPSNNYKIRFTYGDGLTGIYNAQDYKSTIDTTGATYFKTELVNGNVPNGEDNYWYIKENNEKGFENKSVAKDTDTKMTTSNYGDTKSLTNSSAKSLEDYEKVYSNTAETATFCAPLRWAGNTATTSHEYNIENVMNFGLAERPRSELTIEKSVDHINLVATDGTTLIDGSQGAQSVSWTDRYVQPIVDENLIYGSKLTVTYKFTVTNTGEVDYMSANRKFYDYGNIDGNVVTTKADVIVDYVDNNLTFDSSVQLYNEEGAENSKYWEIYDNEELKKLLDKDNNFVENVDKISTKIKTKDKSPLLAELKPGETTKPVYLALTKTLSSASSDDLLTYNNDTEIIQSTNTAGRRSYSIENNLLSDIKNGRGIPKSNSIFGDSKYTDNYILSIPGNLDPVTLASMLEPDSDFAEEVQVIQPFGNEEYYNITIWVIIGTVSALVLAGGVYLIKKKVL